MFARARPPTRVGLAAGIALVGVVASLVWFALAVPAPRAPAPAASVTLSIVPVPGTSAYGLSPPAVRVPSGERVHFTIVNFDPVAHGVPAGMGAMMGTWMGVESIGWGNGSWSNVTSLPPTSVGHTFTVLGGPYDLNVLIPPALGPDHPSVVEFDFATHGGADLTWACDAYGMGGMMGGWGYGGMTGTFDIT